VSELWLIVFRSDEVSQLDLSYLSFIFVYNIHITILDQQLAITVCVLVCNMYIVEVFCCIAARYYVYMAHIVQV
jgi:hypothetical protein